MKTRVFVIGLVFAVLVGCAATTDLTAAKKAGAIWRLVDKATGGSAVGIDKLLAVAKKKFDKGEFDEANRIALRVSWAAHTGIAQADGQASITPNY